MLFISSESTYQTGPISGSQFTTFRIRQTQNSAIATIRWSSKDSDMNISTRFLVIAFFSLAFLSACGGGGGGDGGGSEPPTTSPPVDTQLNWDDDNWDEKDWV